VKRPATHAAATTAPAVTANPSAETASKSADDAAAPAAAASSSAAAASAYAEVATKPAAKGWTSWLFIPFAAAVIVIGTLATFLSKWRKRKLVEQAGEENLSFSSEVISEPGEVDKPVAHKAA
jgi:hypothetical protein